MPEPEAVLPHDDEIEFALLAELLLWPDEAWGACEGTVGWQDFYSDITQKIGRVLIEAIERGSPLDTLLLVKAVRADPVAKEYAERLVIEGYPTGANIPMHVGILKELSMKRGVIGAATQFLEEGKNGLPVAEVLARNRVRTEDLERDLSGHASYNDWSAPELLAAELVAPVVLVGDDDHHLLDEGGLSFIAGKGGLGKSNLAMALAVDLGLGGQTWLGYALPKEPVPTMYLWSEGGDYFAQQRLKKLREAAERSPLCRVLVPKEFTPDLRQPGDLAEMKRLLDRHKPKMVFVDHLTEFTGDMNDSDNSECKVFLRAVTALRRHSGAHFNVIHHNRKPGENSKKGDAGEVRGASALTSAADTVIMLDEEPGERVRVTWSKVKNAAKPEPFICKYQPDTGRYLIETKGLSNPKTSGEAIRQALYDAGKPLTIKELQTAAGLSESTVKRNVPLLVEAGEVLERKGIGFPNTYELPL